MNQRTRDPGVREEVRVENQRQFIRAMSKSIDGQPLTPPERALLNTLFEALLRGEDVSGLTGVKRPRLCRSSDHIHIALHYLCLTRLMHVPAEPAWDTVGDAWGLNRRDVQRLIAQHRKPALATLQRCAGAPDRMLRICERRARGARRQGGRSLLTVPPERPADELIRMLARLAQVQSPGYQ